MASIFSAGFIRAIWSSGDRLPNDSFNQKVQIAWIKPIRQSRSLIFLLAIGVLAPAPLLSNGVENSGTRLAMTQHVIGGQVVRLATSLKGTWICPTNFGKC